MEPKVKIDHGRELDELTKFTKKFFDDLQEYNKDKEDTPNEAHIMVIACDSIGEHLSYVVILISYLMNY